MLMTKILGCTWGENPERSWGIILQQAWTMRLHDRIPHRDQGGNLASGSGFNRNFQNSGGDRRIKSDEPCRKYNKGKCNFGASCKYDHKCSYCLKFGHNVLNCRKMLADRGHQQGRNSGMDRRPVAEGNVNREKESANTK